MTKTKDWFRSWSWICNVMFIHVIIMFIQVIKYPLVLLLPREPGEQQVSSSLPFLHAAVVLVCPAFCKTCCNSVWDYSRDKQHIATVKLVWGILLRAHGLFFHFWFDWLMDWFERFDWLRCLIINQWKIDWFDWGDLQMASRPCHPPLRQPQDGSASGNTHQNVGL